MQPVGAAGTAGSAVSVLLLLFGEKKCCCCLHLRLFEKKVLLFRRAGD